MDAMEQEFHDRLAELHRTNTPGFLGVWAILRLSNDSERTPPAGYSRGDFKRAIKSLRTFQNSDPEYNEWVEDAVALIRRDWLNKEGAV